MISAIVIKKKLIHIYVCTSSMPAPLVKNISIRNLDSDSVFVIDVALFHLMNYLVNLEQKQIT